MRLAHFTVFFAWFTLIAAASADISSLFSKFKLATKSKKVVASPLSKSSIVNKFFRPSSLFLNKRDTVPVEIHDQTNAFMITVEIGSQEISFDAILDTGSADLWVPSTEFCNSTSGCSNSGYSPDASSTSKDTGYDYSIDYVGTQGYEGEIYNDTVNVGGFTLDPAQFAAVNEGETPQPIAGIGYPGLDNKPSYYKNLPQQMQEQGYIDNFGYGIYLDSLSSSDGLIVFGGLFTEGYSGDYKQLPIIDKSSVSSVLSSLYVNLGNDDDTENAWLLQTPIRALFDTGSTSLILPNDMYTKVKDVLNIQSSDDGDVYECSKYDQDKAGFEFDFLGVNISVPLNVIGYSVNDTHCHASISSIDGDYIILGEFFLRAATLYFDLENQLISIAQAELGTNHDDMIDSVREVPADGVSFEKAPDFDNTAVSSAPSGTSITYLATATSSSASSSANSSASSATEASTTAESQSDALETSSSSPSSSSASASSSSATSSAASASSFVESASATSSSAVSSSESASSSSLSGYFNTTEAAVSTTSSTLTNIFTVPQSTSSLTRDTVPRPSTSSTRTTVKRSTQQNLLTLVEDDTDGSSKQQQDTTSTEEWTTVVTVIDGELCTTSVPISAILVDHSSGEEVATAVVLTSPNARTANLAQPAETTTQQASPKANQQANPKANQQAKQETNTVAAVSTTPQAGEGYVHLPTESDRTWTTVKIIPTQFASPNRGDSSKHDDTTNIDSGLQETPAGVASATSNGAASSEGSISVTTTEKPAVSPQDMSSEAQQPYSTSDSGDEGASVIAFEGAGSPNAAMAGGILGNGIMGMIVMVVIALT